jgi:hypothetical protein
VSWPPSRASLPSKVKDKRAENKPDRFVKAIRGKIGIGALQKSALKNFQRGRESTKWIACRH